MKVIANNLSVLFWKTAFNLGKLSLLLTFSLAGMLPARAANTNLVFIRLPDFNATSSAGYISALADLNHDGKPDLVRTANGNQLSVQLGNGDGTFGSPTFYAVGSGPGYLLIADMNNDGKPDLLVANVNDGTLGVLLGNGDGTFQSQIVTNLGFCITSMAVTDFNKDGKLDLILTGYNYGDPPQEGYVKTLAGNGNGTFSAVTTYETSSRTLYTATRDVAVGDFNGDNYPDFIISDPGAGCVVTFLNNQDGTFTRQTEMLVPANVGRLAVGDFNRDGKMDLAFVCASDQTYGNTGAGNNIGIAMGNGDGTFGLLVNQGGAVPFMNQVKIYSAGSAGDTLVPSANNLVATDMDGDGKLDLVLAAEPGSGLSYIVSILHGVGDGTFTPGTQMSADEGSSWVSVGDLNQDGSPDLIVTPNEATTETYLGLSSASSNIIVTTVADEDNGTTDPSVGTGTSLREAWNYVSTLTGPQTINFAANLSGQTLLLTTASYTNYIGVAALHVPAGLTITLQGITGSRSLAIDGGGIRCPFFVDNGGTLILNDLTITNGSGKYGGGLYCAGTVQGTRCTFTGNNSTEGSGVYLDGNSGYGSATGSFVDCTFVGNSSSGGGAGIVSVNSTLSLQHVTICSNYAPGGGALDIQGGNVAITNSIVADNSGSGSGNDVFGSLNASSCYNIIGISGTGGLTSGVNGNILGVPLPMGAFGDNGGSTPTLALPSGSLAINRGLAIAGITTDQRAYPFDGTPDIGAFEYQFIAPTITSVNSTTFLTGLSNVFNFNVNAAPNANISVNGTLPSGVAFNGTALIGRPAAGSGGTYSLTVTATNGTSPDATQNFTLNVVEQSALASNPSFNTNGLGWALNGDSVNGGPDIANNLFTLTDGTGGENRSAWFRYPLYVGGFQASFTYQDIGVNGADGTAFVIQNDPNGTSAIGGAGGGLGYIGISPSVALMLDIYADAPGGPSGWLVSVDGNGDGGGYSSINYQSTTPVNLDGGNPVSVSLRYTGGVLHLAWKDTVTGDTFQTNVTMDIPAFVGTNAAWVGFTGSEGGVLSHQTVGNFSYVPLPMLTAAADGSNQVSLTWPAAIYGYQLQTTTNVNGNGWVNSPVPVAQTNGLNQVVISESAQAEFFRLVLPATP